MLWKVIGNGLPVNCLIILTGTLTNQITTTTKTVYKCIKRTSTTGTMIDVLFLSIIFAK